MLAGIRERIGPAWSIPLSLLLAACGIGGQAATPTPEFCDGIPAEIGGCAPDRPVFAGDTCDGLAREWGRVVDTRVAAIIDGPPELDGKGRGVRVSDALVLASVLVGGRMHELGLLDACDAPEFLPVARSEFSDDLESRVLTVLYDGDPATLADWEFFLARAIDVIDTDERLPSPSRGPT
jgi:hypothetical protein